MAETGQADPANGAILVRCDECVEDLLAWPDPAYPLVPELEHRPDGTHAFLWPDRHRTDRLHYGTERGRYEF